MSASAAAFYATAPTPSAPTPSAPTPSAPTPSAPAPSAPDLGKEPELVDDQDDVDAQDEEGETPLKKAMRE